MRLFWPRLIFVFIFLAAFIGHQRYDPSELPQNKSQTLRIISLAPSITETVFALGLGNNVVAVTKNCDFPAEANNRPKIDGFPEPNLESILQLQADLVILLAGNNKIENQLHKLNIKTLAVSNRTLNDIQQAIFSIGQQTDKQVEAERLLAKIQQDIDFVQHKTTALKKPSVMVSIGHSLDSKTIDSVYIAGQNDFYNDLITLAGGINVYQQTHLQVPTFSMEGILQTNPDIIIDIFPEADDHQFDLSKIQQQWSQLKHVHAVQQNRVHIIEADYATIPGPRITLLLKKMALLIHPEINWNTP